MSEQKLKHLLFYSNYCNYSNEVYQKIIKYNLKDKFYLINISNNKFKIPSNIKSVPTILLSDKKTIYQNHELDIFLNKLYNSTSDDVLPYYYNGNSISDNFSLLNENDNVDNNTLNKGFEYINDTNNNIITPTEDNNNTINVSLEDKMNSIQQNRNSEIQDIFKKKPPPIK